MNQGINNSRKEEEENSKKQMPYQTFIMKTDSLEIVPTSEQPVAKSKLSNLHNEFSKNASSKTQKDFAEIVGYQLGVQSTIQPSLKAHLTSRNRVIKDGGSSSSTITNSQHQYQQSDSNTSNITRQNANSSIRRPSESQLYKMKLEFILNPTQQNQ